MRSLSAQLKTHYTGSVATLANCWKLTRKDGVIFGFTDHDRALAISGVNYEPATGMARTAIAARADLSVDTTDVTALLDSATLTEADLMGGKYDGATIEQFAVNWADLTQGTIVLGYGEIGQITTRRGAFRAEVRGLAQKLQQTIGERYSRFCRADLGDARCGVNLASFTVTGAVTAATGNQVFTDSARAEAAGYFNFGLLTWTGGNNSGLKMEVKSHTTGGVITLFEAMPKTIQIGDTYSMYAGCDKVFTTCKTKFNNAVNFRGEPHIPGMDETLRYPDATAG